ncbi:hypothetical protein SERLADRAFT_408035 [Serpula lacrymans var. lacrymans S7.9]|uniref:Uncharacterized protein n=1 Tax=Serpula lacrymans var. lacrymans (strain S7.9) TaxID=578457 RepID=F8NTV4_SERL9|nr:uncharacterized protein SERLADRAFT_408035 [Serpula lacrymans var. lacrymans S7.9]EGO25774.1 hypothetical protein SERLADRAFT_408035 [Serpula lacrymans var. lacrymans S7.9]
MSQYETHRLAELEWSQHNAQLQFESSVITRTLETRRFSAAEQHWTQERDIYEPEVLGQDHHSIPISSTYQAATENEQTNEEREVEQMLVDTEDSDKPALPTGAQTSVYGTSPAILRSINDLQNIRNDFLFQKSQFPSYRLGYLITLAQVNGVVVDRSITKPVKADYANALIQWWSDVSTRVEIKVPSPYHEPVVDLSKPVSPSNAIMNKGILKEIWFDMANTIIPSWMTRAPRNLGSVNQGYVKADQWRTACTVNCVISLIRLWGHAEASQREKNMLDNYLALVIALHLVECMESFGPVHGWWSFPFERYIGVMQKTNTNNKLRDMELTFFLSFCRGSNLKALIFESSLRDGLRDAVDHFKTLFEKYFGSNFHGTLLNDLQTLSAAEILDEGTYDSSALRPLSKEHESATPQYCTEDDHTTLGAIPISPMVQQRDRITFRGISFTTGKKSIGDSMILYKSDREAEAHAGKIDGIFVHSRAGTCKKITDYFMLVKPFRPLTPLEATFDIYRQYPLLGVRLYHDEFLTESVIIKGSDIVSHFASFLSLDRAWQRKNSDIEGIRPQLAPNDQSIKPKSRPHQSLAYKDCDSLPERGMLLTNKELKWCLGMPFTHNLRQ